MDRLERKMTGYGFNGSSNAELEAASIQISNDFEIAVSEVLNSYLAREGNYHMPVYIFAKTTLPSALRSEQWQQVLEYYENFVCGLSKEGVTPERMVRAFLAGAYHLEGDFLKRQGNDRIPSFEAHILQNIDYAIEYAKQSIDVNLVLKLVSFQNSLPHMRNQEKLEQLIEITQQFSNTLIDVTEGTSEAALREALQALCEFYNQYNKIKQTVDKYNGGWAIQVAAFKKDTLLPLLKTHDLAALQKAVQTFSASLVSSLGVSEALGYGSALKLELEKIAEKMPVHAYPAGKLQALKMSIAEFPLYGIIISEEDKKDEISLSGDLVTPGGPSVDIDLSSSEPKFDNFDIDTNASSSSSSSSSSSAAPRSFLDRLLNRNPTPIQVEFATPKDAKGCQKQYPKLLDKTLDIEKELIALKAQCEEQRALLDRQKSEIKNLNDDLAFSKNSEEMERGWKELQTSQVSKERAKNARLTTQIETLREKVTQLEAICDEQGATISGHALEIARYLQVEHEIEAKAGSKQAELMHTISDQQLIIADLQQKLAAVSRQAADLNGSLMLTSQSSSSSSLTYRFDMLEEEDGRMSKEDEGIVDRLNQLIICSPRPERRNDDKKEMPSPM
jgi:hypothetical protein